VNGDHRQIGEVRRELSDRNAIRDVMLRYASGVDARDLAQVGRLFVAGASYHGALGIGTIESALANLRQRFGDYRATMHWVDHQLIEIAGDHARSETYAVAYHRLKRLPPTNFVVGVRYLDELVRLEGRWLIADRTVVTEWQRSEPISDALHHRPARA